MSAVTEFRDYLKRCAIIRTEPDQEKVVEYVRAILRAHYQARLDGMENGCARNHCPFCPCPLIHWGRYEQWELEERNGAIPNSVCHTYVRFCPDCGAPLPVLKEGKWKIE